MGLLWRLNKVKALEKSLAESSKYSLLWLSSKSDNLSLELWDNMASEENCSL